MIDAEKYLEEAEKKPVYQHLYCYYDKDLKRYNQPYATHEEPANMAEQAKAILLKDPKNAFKFAGMILCYLGKFELKTGTFEIEKDILALVDMDRFISKEVKDKDA